MNVYSYNKECDGFDFPAVTMRVNSVLVLAPCHSRKYIVRDCCSGQGLRKDLGFWSMTGTI